MAPNANIKKAFVAMKALGIEEAKVKPVLKNLLNLYDKNWDLIAEDNFRVLADAIFDQQDAQATQERKGKKKKVDEEEEEAVASAVNRGKKKSPEYNHSVEEEEEAMSEPERPLKRQRRRGEGGSASTLNKSTSPSSGSPTLKKSRTNDEETPSVVLPFHPQPNGNDPGAVSVSIPKDEPSTDSLCIGNSSVRMPDMEKNSGHVEQQNGETVGTFDHTVNGVPPTAIEKVNEHKLATTLQESSALELASSASGEVKINLSFAPASEGLTPYLPSMEELRRAMEEKCLRSYKILDPNFSVIGFMNDICSCYLDLAKKGSNTANQSPESLPFITSNVYVSKRSAARDAVTSGADNELNVSERSAAGITVTSGDSNDQMCDSENDVVGGSKALVVVPECEISADEWRQISNFSDITLGEESVEIPWVNEVNKKVPPLFCYIPQSLVYSDAAVKFSLANIRDEHCCHSCLGDCLSSSTCSCAIAVNGFTYTVDGILKEDFLEECISQFRDPQKQVLQYCKECPLEKVQKEEILEPCKGHLKRKVIKECWAKCGCNKKCGNRVVQQGIQNKLQVFYTPNGRGWGLRTLEKLRKGAFVCEYAGEILTVPELVERSSEKLTSPVILDAYWGSEEVSGDNRALCLDGTQYGNVSRFINHRCLDANLIEIPVHVETPELHYYHVAFFTTREVDAMEELTWDYGVEFNDYVYPTTPFHCVCGSEFCRNFKRSRSKSKNTKKRV